MGPFCIETPRLLVRDYSATKANELIHGFTPKR